MSVPSLTSVLVNIGEGCSIGCAHCGFNGSGRQRTADGDELANWISQACRIGIPLVIFTGGEVFEAYTLLQQGVRATSSAGGQSALFTSCFWAKDLTISQEKLSKLPGLTGLYLSSDLYHQARIPYANIYNVIEAAEELGIAQVKICIHYATEGDRQKVRSHYTDYESRIEFYEERVIPTSKNLSLFKNVDPPCGLSLDEYEDSCWMETPYINPDGEIFACHIGGAGAHGDYSELPHWMGSLSKHSLEDILEVASRSPVYQFLRTHGPRGVAEVVQDYPALRSKLPRRRFYTCCDMCFSVLNTPDGARALREHVQKPAVLTNINILLFTRFGEAPIGE